MIRFIAFLIGLATLGTRVNASIRGNQDQEEPSGVDFSHAQMIRSLVTTDFVPLSCNNQIADCTPWTAKFGTKKIYTRRLLIDCGECVLMDHPGPMLTLLAGLDIRGKLQILRNQNDPALIINSTMVSVQGVLEMSATKAVDGKPLITFVLEGQDDQSFTPIGENSDACGGNDCIVGKKAITVAGGKFDIHGLPPDTPTWLPLHDISSDLSTIIVDASIQDKWQTGAEVLVTSATSKWDDHQVRRIAAVTQNDHSPKQKLVALTLDSPLANRPTTIQDSVDFAVEVALLSRNIVFKGGYDENEVHGAHFWVMRTPMVKQTLEGIDFVGFGQQGNLGRYPIHFHFCGDVPGSAVLRNTIRQSFQRCVVVHGSNKLRIEKNVAFDTKGHCFVTEDGIETDNEFVQNLGAMTGTPAFRIPNLGSNGVETDIDIPSTFWITNASNKFVGNVVAGSEGSGWWFELLVRGTKATEYSHIDPKRQPLGEFVDNVVHSCRVTGLRTYPSGFTPEQEAAFVGLKAYRNSKDVFFHRTSNVAVIGGIFADSNVAIDIDRSEGVRVDGAEIVGESDSYRKLMLSNRLDSFVCFAPHIGIELYTAKTEYEYENKNIVIENVRFSGFGHIPCNDALIFSMDDTIKTKAFDLFTTVRNVTVEADAALADFCNAESVGVVDIFLLDLDGSLAPAGTSVKTPSALVSDNPIMLTFMNQTKCTKQVDRCYSYCADVCLRSVRYETNPTETENHKLKVCDKRSLKSCIFVSGYQMISDSPDSTRNRVFYTHLPPGAYDAVFVDQDGRDAWPSFVEIVYETPLCPSALSDDAISLRAPAMDGCKILLQNGNFQASAVEPKFWLARQGGITLNLFGGKEDSQSASAVEKTGLATMLQYVDSRCLVAFIGQFFQIKVGIKLTRDDSSVITCNPGTMKCPDVGFFSEDFGFLIVATVEPASDGDGFQKAEGFVKITDAMAQASSVAMFVRSNVDGVLMTIDNALANKVEDASQYCENLFRYSTFADLAFVSLWESSFMGRGTVSSVNPGYNSPYAMLYSGRSEIWDGPSYKRFRNIETECLRPSSSWRLVAHVKLIDRAGLGVICDPQKVNDCPTVRVSIKDREYRAIFKHQSTLYASAWSVDRFNKLSAEFTLPSYSSTWDGSIGTVNIDFRNFPIQYDIVVGKVVLTPTSYLK